MKDIILICVLVISFVIGYYKIEKVDKFFEHIKQPQIMIIYDKDYHYIKKYQNDEIICIEKSELLDFSKQFRTIIICTIDDYYNLLMNYRIQKYMQSCQVYAICHEQQYLNLYYDRHIHVLQTKDDIKGLMVRLYDKNLETSHKC